MGSPFPGMDPYLEQHWGDVHHGLVTYARDQLQSRLPKSLRARMEERVFVETESGDFRSIYPDVHVVEYPKPTDSVDSADSSNVGVAVTEPIVIRLLSDPIEQPYIEIVNVASGNRVVTVIEFLSPSNKSPSDGLRPYLQKRQELRDAQVNLVEIDLTRSGTRDDLFPIALIPPAHLTTYQACVRRGWKLQEFEIYRIPLAERLPVVGVPLRETDKDVALDLQALIEQCYRNGAYDTLDYRVEPNPPLNAEDATWCGELLKSKKLR